MINILIPSVKKDVYNTIDTCKPKIMENKITNNNNSNNYISNNKKRLIPLSREERARIMKNIKEKNILSNDNNPNINKLYESKSQNNSNSNSPDNRDVYRPRIINAQRGNNYTNNNEINMPINKKVSPPQIYDPYNKKHMPQDDIIKIRLNSRDISSSLNKNYIINSSQNKSNSNQGNTSNISYLNTENSSYEPIIT
jgi:hypothetical protein